MINQDYHLENMLDLALFIYFSHYSCSVQYLLFIFDLALHHPHITILSPHSGGSLLHFIECTDRQSKSRLLWEG